MSLADADDDFEVESPCVSQCGLDPETNICNGCGRSLDEIRAWKLASNREKLEEAFRKFEAYERKMDNMEAEVEAQDLGRSRTLHDEFAELERNDKVESELEALKASMHRRSEN